MDNQREYKLFDAGALNEALSGDDKLEAVIRVLIDSIGESAVTIEQCQRREEALRTGLNNLIGAIIHKNLTKGLEDELAQARALLNSPA